MTQILDLSTWEDGVMLNWGGEGFKGTSFE